jgi:hypothetical protein
MHRVVHALRHNNNVMRRRRIIFGVGIALIVICTSLFAYHDWAWNERTRQGWIKLRQGGVPLRAIFFVHDNTGRGLSGVDVDILNNSGWNGPKKTDEKGYAVIDLGELDVQKVVAGQITMRRDKAYWLGSPHVRNGVTIDVLIREPKEVK